MAKSRRRGPAPDRPLTRRAGNRVPRRTVLVFCEGKRTEPEYLKALKRTPEVHGKASVDIRIDRQSAGAVPMTLVTAAVAARERATGEDGEIDEVWCLFDVEWPHNHPQLGEAVAIARENDVRLAISNPCFELWLALHFEDHTAWLDTDSAVRLRRDHDRSIDKSVDSGTYMPRRDDAAQRARLLADRHETNGTEFPHDNPSSGMYRFLDAISNPAPDINERQER